MKTKSIPDDSKKATIEPFKSLLGIAWGPRYCEVCKKRIYHKQPYIYLGDPGWIHKKCESLYHHEIIETKI